MKVTASEVKETLEPWAQRNLESMLEGQRSIAIEFLEYLADERTTLHTRQNYLTVIKSLAALEIPFELLEHEDLRRWSRQLDSKFKPGTADMYRLCAKRFLKWVHNGGDSSEYPPCVSWIKMKNIRQSYGRKVLSKQEVRQLIDVADNQRDRALLFVAYESGCRASELVGLRIRDVELDQYGAVIRVSGKSGEIRLRLFESVPDLQLWLSMHPICGDPSAPLWPSKKTKNQAIRRRAFGDLVNKYAKKAALKKSICPHMFRHSRATHLATVLKESQMREFFGWSRASDMPSIYVHLSGRDVDETLFEHYGIKTKASEKEESPLTPRACPRCDFENPPSAKFCQRCSAVLDLPTAIELEAKCGRADELTAKVLERFIKKAPEVLKRILEEEGLDKEIEKMGQSEEAA